VFATGSNWEKVPPPGALSPAATTLRIVNEAGCADPDQKRSRIGIESVIPRSTLTDEILYVWTSGLLTGAPRGDFGGWPSPCRQCQRRSHDPPMSGQSAGPR